MGNAIVQFRLVKGTIFSGFSVLRNEDHCEERKLLIYTIREWPFPAGDRVQKPFTFSEALKEESRAFSSNGDTRSFGGEK